MHDQIDLGRPQIQLIRGLPGAGKSTLAKKFDCQHLELDHYCIRGRKYVWSPERDKTAYNFLIWRIRDEMRANIDLVVSGVFSSPSGRLGLIVRYACEFGYEVYIKTLTSAFGNIHACRECDIDRMRRAFVEDDCVRAGLAKLFPKNTEWLKEHVHYGLMQTTSDNIPFTSPA